METCAGCGAQLAPTWKYCIHCGVAVERSQKQTVQPQVIDPAAERSEAAQPEAVPAAIRPQEDAVADVPGDDSTDTIRRSRNVNIALLVGGITAFVIAVGFIGLAIAYAVGALK